MTIVNRLRSNQSNFRYAELYRRNAVLGRSRNGCPKPAPRQRGQSLPRRCWNGVSTGPVAKPSERPAGSLTCQISRGYRRANRRAYPRRQLLGANVSLRDGGDETMSGAKDGRIQNLFRTYSELAPLALGSAMYIIGQAIAGQRPDRRGGLERTCRSPQGNLGRPVLCCLVR